ncbi:MAG: tyrosine-protein kinase Etk/Wzc [Saprospiraceae bacterium]|jgi:tyrosine-protein kinase Etk/Wzc
MMEHKDNLLGVLKTLFKWKKQILYVCLIAGIGTVVISLFMDNYYTSFTSFYAASPDQALPEPVGVESGKLNYYGGSEDIDRVLSVAESNEVANYLINKYNLYEHYDIDTTHRLAPFHVGQAFRKHFNVQKTKYDAIELSIEDKDPELAAEMVNDARWKVGQIAEELIKSNQRIKIEMYKQTISDKLRELSILGDTLQIVREKYGVYNADAQSEGLSAQISQSESKRARERARRDILATHKGISRDTIAMIDAMVSGMDQQIISLDGRLDKFNEGVGQVLLLEQIHLASSEQLSLDKERLKQLESIYNTHINTIFLVEKGEVPIFKSRPGRSLICIAAVFIAFILSIVVILILEVYKDLNWREIVYAK